ncbi:MAG: two-component regulator propeller domain-containing protein, partial [Bacteroidota bacterium]
MKLICLLPLLFGSGLFANSYSHHDAGLEHFGMVQYGRADGLACSRVFCAMQDDLGYVWLGTEYGVTRYDGEQFENFSLREGVGDHAIINIEADSRGILWFLSAAGELSCYFEGQFFNAENSEVMRAASGKTFLFSTCELPDGSLWITTDKDHPVRISPDGRVNRAPKFTHIVRHGHPRLIFPEPDGRLTAVDAWGIFDFNAPDSNYTFVFDMEQPKFAGRYTQMEPGEYLIADVDNRIHHLKDHKVSPWFAPAENPIDALIVQLQRLADGSVWVGTFDGAWCLREGKIVGRVLEGYSVSDILQDSEGNIWFTTHHNGVFLMPALNFRRFPIPQPHLKPQSVTAIHSDPDGSVYFGGTGSDVWHLQGDGVLNDLIDLPATKMERGVSRICRMDEELVLIGSKAGLLIEWKGQRRFVRVGGIRALEVLSDGRVMMAVGKKLCLMDRREILALWEEWDQKPGPNLYDIKAALVMRHRVAKGRFHALLELGPDSILVSLDGGLQLWHAGKLRAAPRGLQGIQSKAIGMLKAGPSEYWIATRGKGLLRYRSGKLDVFDETNGLLSNHCTALAQDRFGNIWLATLSGLNLLPNGKRSAIRSFTVANGLPSDEIHALAFRGDSLILGSQSGPCWMRGRELEAFLTPPRFF